MTDHCNTCGHWIELRKTVYGDGTEIVTYSAARGKGRCSILEMETASSFGCLSYDHGDHVEVTRKDGEPWQHWVQGPCPDCEGKGSITHGVFGGRLEYSVCARCVGTGSVRHYDDGHVGENRHRRHPKEQQACTPTAEPVPTSGMTSQPEKKHSPIPDGII